MENEMKRLSAGGFRNHLSITVSREDPPESEGTTARKCSTFIRDRWRCQSRLWDHLNKMISRPAAEGNDFPLSLRFNKSFPI